MGGLTVTRFASLRSLGPESEELLIAEVAKKFRKIRRAKQNQSQGKLWMSCLALQLGNIRISALSFAGRAFDELQEFAQMFFLHQFRFGKLHAHAK
jgi:hypothetical protein